MLLVVALLIIMGSIAGAGARRLHLPSLTGQILVGILLGDSFLHIVPHQPQPAFQALVTFAVSLVAFTIGGHLEFRRLHNAKRRILVISVVQTMLTYFTALAAFQLFNPFGLPPAHQWSVHLILASIASSTSPVSTLHIIREKRARGLLVKTTIAVVAINNLLTIALFAVSRSIASGLLTSSGDVWGSFGRSMIAVLLSILIGAATGFLLVFYCRRVTQSQKEEGKLSQHDRAVRQGALFTGLLVAMSLAAGVAEYIALHFGHLQINPSPILANMVAGLVLANQSSFKDELLSLFNELESVVFTLFFVLAGSHFQPGAAKTVIGASVLYIAIRSVAKLVGGRLGGRLGQATPAIATNIGPMLFAQGAIAIALVVVIEKDPNLYQFQEILTACVLTGVVVFELASGPVIGRSLDRARQSGQDRTRLIEFLQEEFILPRLYAKDKWDVLEEAAYFLARAHRMQTPLPELLNAVRAREEEISTAIGKGVAVPHARITEGDQVLGILARLDPPVKFDAPDDEPVRLVVMIATPEGMENKHVQIIAAVARMMQNEKIRNALFEAETAGQLHEIIESEEAETFNYFIDT